MIESGDNHHGCILSESEKHGLNISCAAVVALTKIECGAQNVIDKNLTAGNRVGKINVWEHPIKRVGQLAGCRSD